MSRAFHLERVAVVAVVVAVAGSACAPVATQTRRQHPLFGAEAGQHEPRTIPSWRSPFDDAMPNDGAEETMLRERLAAAAAASVGDRPIVVGGVRYRFDCSGVAAGIYAKAGVPVDDGSGAPSARALYGLVAQGGSLRRDNPLPGDFVFFDNTYDANGNGVRDDPLSHVGVVQKVLGDGTVVFVHRIGDKIVRWRLNPKRPRDRADEKGNALNHYLRVAEGATPALLTGELFVAYGSLDLRETAGRQKPRLAAR